MKSRFFRALICFVVVCALVINISPIKTYAYVGSLTSMGIIAIAFLLSAGVVFNPSTPEVVNALGTSLELGLQEWSDTVGNVSEDLSDLWAQADALDKWREKNDPYYSEYNPDFDDIPDAPEDSALKIKLAKGLLTGIAAWIGGAITSGILADGEAAPEGYAYYNGVLLPSLSSDMLSALSDGTMCAFIVQHIESGEYYLRYGNGAFSVAPYEHDDCDWIYFYSPDGSRRTFSDYQIESETWTRKSGTWVEKVEKMGFLLNRYNLIWTSNDNIYSSDKTFIDPIYISDISHGIHEGTHTYEDLDLPEIIDLEKLLPDSDTDTTSSLDKMQDITKQLEDGKMTYEDLLKMLQSDLDSDVVPDATTPTTPDEPVDTSTIQDYKLDLTDFFPFCLPFDIYEFLLLLDAEPETPKFTFTFNFGEYLGRHELVIDLSPWNDTALLLRRLELLLFIIGLAMATRNYYLRG